MSNYTPTTERVRNSYANDVASYPKPANVFEAAARADSAKEEFDRWLAEHDREVKADAWDEGERHESDYLIDYGQFCPHKTCNPYREANK